MSHSAVNTSVCHFRHNVRHRAHFSKVKSTRQSTNQASTSLCFTEVCTVKSILSQLADDSGVSGRVCILVETYQAVIYNGDAVTARLIAEELNAGHC